MKKERSYTEVEFFSKKRRVKNVFMNKVNIVASQFFSCPFKHFGRCIQTIDIPNFGKVKHQ